MKRGNNDVAERRQLFTWEYVFSLNQLSEERVLVSSVLFRLEHKTSMDRRESTVGDIRQHTPAIANLNLKNLTTGCGIL